MERENNNKIQIRTLFCVAVGPSIRFCARPCMNTQITPSCTGQSRRTEKWLMLRGVAGGLSPLLLSRSLEYMRSTLRRLRVFSLDRSWISGDSCALRPCVRSEKRIGVYYDRRWAHFLAFKFQKRTFGNRKVHPEKNQVMTHEKPLRHINVSLSNLTTRNEQTNADQRSHCHEADEQEFWLMKRVEWFG